MGIGTHREFGNRAANGGTAGIGVTAENGEEESGVQRTGKGIAVGTGVTAEKEGEESEAQIPDRERGGVGMGSERTAKLNGLVTRTLVGYQAMIQHIGESFRQYSEIQC